MKRLELSSEGLSDTHKRVEEPRGRRKRLSRTRSRARRRDSEEDRGLSRRERGGTRHQNNKKKKIKNLSILVYHYALLVTKK